MAYILHVDTSTKICSVALHLDQQVIALQELYSDKSHSGMLTSMIESILHQCDCTLDSLDAISVASGPGSYTGLRIGLSSAKGLAFAQDIPLITVSTLDTMTEAMAHQFPDKCLVPMLDARRMEVFMKITDSYGTELLPIAPHIIDATSFDSWNHKQLILFGEGADKLTPTLELPSHVTIVKGIRPSAKFGNLLIHNKFINSEFSNVAYSEPQYIKEVHITAPKVK